MFARDRDKVFHKNMFLYPKISIPSQSQSLATRVVIRIILGSLCIASYLRQLATPPLKIRETELSEVMIFSP